MVTSRLSLAGGGLAALLAGCGSEPPHIPQALATTPVAAANVAITETGDPTMVIDPASVSFGLDDARLLVVRLRVRSAAAGPVTVMVRASIFDAGDHLVGDATGGQDAVAPGITVPIRLTGPTPTGTISRTTFEVTTKTSP